MSGKEKIIVTILDEAKAEAEKIMLEADKKIADIRSADEKFAREAEAKKNEDIAANDLAILSRSRLTAELDVRKAVLQKKQEKLSEAFKKAKEAIFSSDEAYIAFIGGVIEQYAEDGDEVVVCKADEKRITAALVKKCAEKKAISLTYRADGGFFGGIILEGKNCDKNMTLDTIVGEYKKNNENRIADILFGE